MKKTISRLLVAALTALLSVPTNAQTLSAEAVSATWAQGATAEGEAAALAPEGSEAYFKNTYVSIGSDLSVVGTGDVNGATQAKLQPAVGSQAAEAINAVDFIVVPKKGLTFTPTKVSLKATRWGTDGGKIDVSWLNADGTTASLQTGLNPNRNNADVPASELSYAIADGAASDDACGVRVNIYALGTTKQISLSDIVIEGTLSGTVIDVKQCSLSVSVQPQEAGEVEVSPTGTVFDSGDEITLSQERNFGFKFKNWTDAQGNVLSSDEAYSFTIADNTDITANYEAINTYELVYNVDGGANLYMVQPTPEPTVVDGKNMYEEGASVTLAASDNKILSFTGWSSGETSAEISVKMDGDKQLTANYSAVDFIAGWDFYEAGGNGRTADFAAADNDADAFILRDEDGNTSGWLDKSQMAAGGYEGKPAAVNWRNNVPIGTYYWQTMVNAKNFTNIVVSFAMLYNYNSYTLYNIDYSFNGTDWTKAGEVVLTGAKTWVEKEVELPTDADNQETLYIRWKADTSSDIAGAESANDGNAIAEVFILGTEKPVDDGTAPKLVSTMPAEGSTTASANGRIVLTFDEKVKVADGATATLNGETIEPQVSGRTLIFAYSGLDYATEYTFTLAASSVSDLMDNKLDEAISVKFTTRTQPVVEKALYDFIVPDDGNFREAVDAANKRDDTSKRFRIFIKQGNYQIPAHESATITGSDGKTYASPITTVSTPNVSIIGEALDNTMIVNTVPELEAGAANPIEGLHNNETLNLTGAATNTYIQDLYIKNGFPDNTGRCGALEDASDKTVCKNVALHGYQDTYLSNNSNGRFYFEGGTLRGRTDYLCGKGDVFYNQVQLLICAAGGFIVAPSQPKKYGYVFRDCTIDGEVSGIDGNYTLGRPWGAGTPRALYVNTTMNVKPSADGWSEMGGYYPARLAEWNSHTAAGTVISTANRKTTFGDGHTNDPTLTEEEANELTLENVMGGDDNWDPTALTEQAPEPEDVKIVDNKELTWANNNYVLLWAVCADGKVIGFTTEPSFAVDGTAKEYSVRAANAMGGLGAAVKAEVSTGIVELSQPQPEAVETTFINLAGRATTAKGVTLKIEKLADGSIKTTKAMK